MLCWIWYNGVGLGSFLGRYEQVTHLIQFSRSSFITILSFDSFMPSIFISYSPSTSSSIIIDHALSADINLVSSNSIHSPLQFAAIHLPLFFLSKSSPTSHLERPTTPLATRTETNSRILFLISRGRRRRKS